MKTLNIVPQISLMLGDAIDMTIKHSLIVDNAADNEGT